MQLVRTLIGLLAVIGFAADVTAQIPTGSDSFEIAENIHSFRYAGTRTLWIEMPDNVVVFDPISVKAAALLREHITSVTPKPVSHVIYSHEHYDHIRGGQIFADEGAAIISHEKCLDTFDYVPDPDVVKPTITFPGNYTLDLGGPKIELLYFGRNQGDCLVVANFPNERLLFIVDLLTDNRLPFGSLPDFYPSDTLRTLQEIQALDFDRIARGHLDAVVGRDVLNSTTAYWSDLLTSVKAKVDSGIPVFEIIETHELPQYKSWANYDRWFKLHVERVVWQYSIGW